jgi:hypothetical protein
MHVLGPRICLWVIAVAHLGCFAPRAATPPARNWVRTELYFGLSRPDGTIITDAEWAGFVNASITPRFPAGFTVLPAQGYFGSRDQTPHSEPTRLLILFHDPAAQDRATDHITAVATEFARQFNQESVLRIDAPVRATFANARSIAR